jgi:DNA methylase
MTDPAQHATAAAGSQWPEVTSDREAPPLSVWTTAQRDARAQRAGRYPPAALAHPGKMLPAIAATAITRYTAAGDLVADPMCGIGTTLIEAVHVGRHGVGVEYEPRWAAARAAASPLRRHWWNCSATTSSGTARAPAAASSAPLAAGRCRTPATEKCGSAPGPQRSRRRSRHRYQEPSHGTDRLCASRSSLH